VTVPSNNPNPANETEIEALCARAAAGDSGSLQRLIVLHHGRLLAFVTRRVGVDFRSKIDAEDVLQDGYAAAYTTIGKFTYQGEDSFYQWISRIADQRFIDRVRMLRRKKRDAGREIGQGPPGGGGGGDRSRFAPLIERLPGVNERVSQIIRKREAAGGIIAAMAALPEDYRLVVGRVYLDGATTETVAAELGRTPDAVRRLLGRALEKLREEVGDGTRWV